jgi:hypothetical protein
MSDNKLQELAEEYRQQVQAIVQAERKALTPYVRDWNAGRPAGMYLTLHHGRLSKDEDMDDWGFDGPIIGPLQYLHVTYCSDIKYGTVDGEAASNGPSHVILLDEDLLGFDGKLYGDWELQMLEARE